MAKTKERSMTFLTSDVARKIGLGFLLGVMGAVAANPALAQAVAGIV